MNCRILLDDKEFVLDCEFDGAFGEAAAAGGTVLQGVGFASICCSLTKISMFEDDVLVFLGVFGCFWAFFGLCFRVCGVTRVCE